jgi:2-oxoisovalerate dehydrogenase E1 component
MRKGSVRFWIGGPGEEVHGAATALAMATYDRQFNTGSGEWSSALFPHYRSDALATMLAELRGHPSFTAEYFRQALGKATDTMSKGRQMVMHLSLPEYGIMPAQSPLGMNLGKAAGYAKGLQALGKSSGVAVTVCGDGTTGTSDFHETFMAASLWRLPLVVIVTDNEIAISVTPEEGRGIRSFKHYSEAFGAQLFECDGYDLDDTYVTTLQALRYAHNNGPVLLHAKVPRLRGHSSSDGAVFCYDTRDPLLELGHALCKAGVVDEGAICRRKAECAKRDFFEDHVLGRYMETELRGLRTILETVRAEPAPKPEDAFEHALPDFPLVAEPQREGQTALQINEALNLALHRTFEEGNALAYGQDIAGDKGGVFKVTRGLADRFPEHVFNAPINEPLIAGTAVGAAHHKALRLFPEIQFGDYSLNTLHWLVHAGNIYWSSGGQVPLNVTLRTPTEPVPGGALYHSMPVDGYFTPVQGWVIVSPSTAFDAYGLLRSAAEYPGPVLILEPKLIYRMTLGPKLPGEEHIENAKQVRKSRGDALLSVEDMRTVSDFRIPFGKAAIRREGSDVTIVTYGGAVLKSLKASESLEKDGIHASVIDLRSLSPWDHKSVLADVAKTGRMVVAHEDRVYAGFGREVQGHVVEALPGVKTRVVGMQNVPAVGSAKELERGTILNAERIEAACRELMRGGLHTWLNNEEAWMNHRPTRRGC